MINESIKFDLGLDGVEKSKAQAAALDASINAMKSSIESMKASWKSALSPSTAPLQSAAKETASAMGGLTDAANEAAVAVKGVGAQLADLVIADTAIGKIQGGLQGMASGNIIGGLQGVAGGVKEIAQKIYEAGKAVLEFAQQGAALNQVNAAFEKLGGSAEKMDALRAATGGMVSDAQLQKIANQANLMGVPLTTTIELLKRAAGASASMGMSMEQAASDVMTAFTRQSVEIADNLGINMGKLEKIQGDYAAKVGKNINQLTDAEKKLAFEQAFLEKSTKQLELGMLAANEPLAASSASIDNLVNSTKMMVAEQINASGVVDMLYQGIGFLGNVVKELAPTVGSVFALVKSVFSRLGGVFNLLSGALKLIKPVVDLVALAFDNLMFFLGPIIDAIGFFVGGALGKFGELLGWITGKVTELYNALKGGVVDFFKDMFNPEPVDKTTGSIKEQIKAVRDLTEATKKQTEANKEQNKERVLGLAKEIESQTYLNELMGKPAVELKKGASATKEASTAMGTYVAALRQSADVTEANYMQVLLIQDAVRATGKTGEEALEEYGMVVVQQLRGFDTMIQAVGEVNEEVRAIQIEQSINNEAALTLDQARGEAVKRIAERRGLEAKELAVAYTIGTDNLAVARESLKVQTKSLEVSELQTQEEKDRLAARGLLGLDNKDAAKKTGSGNGDARRKLILEAELIGLDEVERQLVEASRKYAENLKIAGRDIQAQQAASLIYEQQRWELSIKRAEAEKKLEEDVAKFRLQSMMKSNEFLVAEYEKANAANFNALQRGALMFKATMKGVFDVDLRERGASVFDSLQGVVNQGASAMQMGIATFGRGLLDISKMSEAEFGDRTADIQEAFIQQMYLLKTNGDVAEAERLRTEDMIKGGLLRFTEALATTQASWGEFTGSLGGEELSSGAQQATEFIGGIETTLQAVQASIEAGAGNLGAALAGAKALTTSFVKDLSTKAALMALWEGAEVLKSIAEMNYPAAAAHTLAAIKYGIVAAKGGKSAEKPSAQKSYATTAAAPRQAAPTRQTQIVQQNFYSVLDTRSRGEMVADALNAGSRYGVRVDGAVVGDSNYMGGF